MRLQSAVGALVGALAFLLAAVAAVGPWPVLFAVAVAVGWCLEVLLRRYLHGLNRLLANAQVGSVFRFTARDVLLLVLLAGSTHASSANLRWVALALLAALILRTAAVIARDDIRRRSVGLEWRNLDVPGVRSSPSRTPRWAGDITWSSLWCTVPIYVGAIAVTLDAPDAVLAAGLVVGIAAAAGVALLAAADWLRVRRDTPEEEVAERLAAALARLAPEIVLYFSRPDPPRFSRYIVGVWVPTLERLDRPIVVVLRERQHLDSVGSDRLPVVLIPRTGDLEKVLPPSVRLALYPSNVMKNNHLIRLPGITDVFIGHGDSDKGGSATTLTRIFDEIWVSGPAARDRYRLAGVGVRDEQIREVGRPQLSEIEAAGTHELLADAADAGRRLTVLYAPTREGFYADWNYSSVLGMGANILTTLMDMAGVRVVFRPHPGTGTDDPAFGAEVEVLRELVQRRGLPHAVSEGVSLYAAFNAADLLISDISSVITDFLASGKPYIVTDPNGEDAELFRAKFPSAAGAPVLGPDCAGLRQMVEQALTADPMRPRRLEVARYLLGDISVDPFERFARAVDDVLAEPGRPDGAAQRLAAVVVESGP